MGYISSPPFFFKEYFGIRKPMKLPSQKDNHHTRYINGSLALQERYGLSHNIPDTKRKKNEKNWILLLDWLFFGFYGISTL